MPESNTTCWVIFKHCAYHRHQQPNRRCYTTGGITQTISGEVQDCHTIGLNLSRTEWPKSGTRWLRSETSCWNEQEAQKELGLFIEDLTFFFLPATHVKANFIYLYLIIYPLFIPIFYLWSSLRELNCEIPISKSKQISPIGLGNMFYFWKICKKWTIRLF